MSTAADIRTAWNTNVFSHATVTAISANALTAEWTEQTRKHLSGLFESDRIDFFNYLVTRRPIQDQIAGNQIVTYEYEVEVNYYLEAKPDRSNYTTAIDAFEAVSARVISGLGSSWAGTVDFSTLPEAQPDVEAIEINSRACWRVTQVYTAIKTTGV